MGEEGTIVEVCAVLLQGTLERDLVVDAASGGGTATGMFIYTYI